MDSILVKFEPLNLHLTKKQDLVDLKKIFISELVNVKS